MDYGLVFSSHRENTSWQPRTEGVIRARAVDPRPDTVKTTKDGLLNIKVGPWSPSEVITQGSVNTPSRGKEEYQPTQEERPIPRGVRITEELLERFSHTKGCPRCEAMKRGDETRTVHHSKTCRATIEKAMADDVRLPRQVSEADERKTRYLARKVHDFDQG